MEKSINIHRALRTTLHLLLTSVLSLVFGVIGLVVGLLEEIIAGVLRIFWAIVLYVLSVMVSPFDYASTRGKRFCNARLSYLQCLLSTFSFEQYKDSVSLC